MSGATAVPAAAGKLRAAVLGSPISHSKSPQLHGVAYRHLGLDVDYTRVQVDESTLGEFLQGAGAGPDWLGWSVTMPLKAAMVGHMTTVSDRVRTLGVLNTVVHRTGEDGARHLYGENTDVDGIIQAFSEVSVGADKPNPAPPTTERIFGLIGAGGTAAAALAAAAEMGFGSAVVYARSPERAASLEPVADALGLVLLLRPLELFHQDLSKGLVPQALVSTLPPRAADSLGADLPALPAGTALLDVAYDPWPSALATGWQRSGGVVVSGLAMLLHQAVHQVELFTADTVHPAGLLSESSHAQMVDSMRAALGGGAALN